MPNNDVSNLPNDFGTVSNAHSTDPIPLVYGRVSRAPAVQLTDSDGIRLIHDNYPINKFEKQTKVKNADNNTSSHIWFEENEDYVNYKGYNEFNPDVNGIACTLYQTTGGGSSGSIINYETADKIAECKNFVLPKGGNDDKNGNIGIHELQSVEGYGYATALARHMGSNGNRSFYWKFSNHPELNSTYSGGLNEGTMEVRNYSHLTSNNVGRYIFLTFNDQINIENIYADFNIGEDSQSIEQGGTNSGSIPLKLFMLPFALEIFNDENLLNNSLENILQNITSNGDKRFSTKYWKYNIGNNGTLAYVGQYWGDLWTSKNTNSDTDFSKSKVAQTSYIDGQPLGYLETDKLLIFENFPDEGQTSSKSYYRFGNFSAETLVKITNPSSKKIYCSLQGRKNYVSTENFFAVPHLFQWLEGFVSLERLQTGHNGELPNFQIIEDGIVDYLYENERYNIWSSISSINYPDVFLSDFDDSANLRSDKWSFMCFNMFIKKLCIGLHTREIFENNLQDYILTEDTINTYNFTTQDGFSYNFSYQGVAGYCLNFGYQQYWDNGQGIVGDELWQSEFRNSQFYSDNNFTGSGQISWYNYLWNKYADHIRCAVRYMLRNIYLIPFDEFPQSSVDGVLVNFTQNIQQE